MLGYVIWMMWLCRIIIYLKNAWCKHRAIFICICTWIYTIHGKGQERSHNNCQNTNKNQPTYITINDINILIYLFILSIAEFKVYNMSEFPYYEMWVQVSFLNLQSVFWNSPVLVISIIIFSFHLSTIFVTLNTKIMIS